MSKELITKGVALAKKCDCNKKALMTGYLAFVGIASVISLASIIKRRRIERKVEKAVFHCIDDLVEKSLAESQETDDIDCDFDCENCKKDNCVVEEFK